MLYQNFDSEMDSMTPTDDENANFSLPASRVHKQESQNPFNSINFIEKDGDVTPRITLSFKKPVYHHSDTAPDLEGLALQFQHKERRMTDSEPNSAQIEKTTASHSLFDQSASPKNDDISPKITSPKQIIVTPYQTKLNYELLANFSKLRIKEEISESYIIKHKVNLRPFSVPSQRKTLILDLDGTLICTSRHIAPGISNEKILPFMAAASFFDKDDGFPTSVIFQIRPYVRKLLKVLNIFYEIIVFTAGKSSYAKAIVNAIDPQKKFISYILNRSHCIMTPTRVLKDLRILGNRDLKDIIILDNSVISFSEQLDNGIYIPTFEGNPNDNELLKIIDFLKEIAEVKDIRPYVSEFSGIKKLYEEYKSRK